MRIWIFAPQCLCGEMPGNLTAETQRRRGITIELRTLGETLPMRLSLSVLFMFVLSATFAQRPALTPEQEASLVFPVIKGSKECGVLPVKDPDFKLDPKQQYKVLLDVTVWSSDSLAAIKTHPGLEEIGRELNLHVYGGVPKKNLHFVAVFHGPALRALLNNATYKKATKKEVNPNIALVEELQKAGVRFIACGQALARRGFEKSDLLPGVELAVSAKTTSSYFQNQGYALFSVAEE
jgi:intracellular sulfur oxidation DsrE/DsrF family protein